MSTRAWAAVSPVLAVMTPLGRLVIVAAAVALGAGVVLGWQELVYLGVTLAVAVLLSTLFLIGRAEYRVRIELDPVRVVAGGRALGQVTVTNAAAGRSTPTRLEVPVGAARAEFVIPALDPGARHEDLFAVPTLRRAVIVAGPAVSVRGDPIGLLRRAVRWTDEIELFVHPVTARLDPSASGLLHDLEGEPTTTITSSDISFHALRAYEPGDDRRNVHWRTSARTGQLMVRQFEETRRSQLTLLLGTDRRAYASDAEFELAVSIAASLGVQVIADGQQLVVAAESARLNTRSRTALLDDCSRLEQAASPFAQLREVARAATRRLPSPSSVIVVGGSLLPIDQLRPAQRLFGRDVRMIAFRAADAAESGVSVIGGAGGLAVATVGRLTDLAGLVRRLT